MENPETHSPRSLVRTIVIPSARDWSRSSQSIGSAAHFAHATGAHVLVYDTSEDDDKWEQLTRLECERFKIVRAKKADMLRNWRCAVESLQSDLTLILSDDDQLIATGEPFSDELDEDVIGIRPALVISQPGLGAREFFCFRVDETTALERVQSYMRQCAGKNCMLYSFFRHNVLLESLRLFDRVHPTRAMYLDWALMLRLVSLGRIAHDKASLLLYQNNNWDTAFHIRESNERLFTDVGLSPRGALFIPFLLALDALFAIENPEARYSTFLSLVLTGLSQTTSVEQMNPLELVGLRCIRGELDRIFSSGSTELIDPLIQQVEALVLPLTGELGR